MRGEGHLGCLFRMIVGEDVGGESEGGGEGKREKRTKLNRDGVDLRLKLRSLT